MSIPSLQMQPPLDRLARKMERDWDRRARQNALHYIDTARTRWDVGQFFRSGEQEIAEDVLTDMDNVCQGRDPAHMRVLEIGCGAGRCTRALARIFGEVHAVDVSGEMIRRARELLAGLPNVRLYKNNGLDLADLPGGQFDFAYSVVVFQHIPRREVIESYVREVHRVLRPGALFKFQVQGDLRAVTSPEDTWVGVPFSDAELVAMACRCGFEPRYRTGAGEQYFWAWFFKQPDRPTPHAGYE